MNPITEGMRFNIIGIKHTFERKPSDPPGLCSGAMSMEHVVYVEDVPIDRMRFQVHQARLVFGDSNIMIEPSRLHKPEDFGFDF